MRLIMVVLLGTFAGIAQAKDMVGPPAPDKYAILEAPSPLRQTRTDLAWMAGAAALDLGTTEFALRRCETCREGNPLGSSPNARLGLKLGVTAGVSALCYHLHKQGHHRKAKIARWTVVGAWVAASVVNLTHSR